MRQGSVQHPQAVATAAHSWLLLWALFINLGVDKDMGGRVFGSRILRGAGFLSPMKREKEEADLCSMALAGYHQLIIKVERHKQILALCPFM